MSLLLHRLRHVASGTKTAVARSLATTASSSSNPTGLSSTNITATATGGNERIQASPSRAKSSVAAPKKNPADQNNINPFAIPTNSSTATSTATATTPQETPPLQSPQQQLDSTYSHGKSGTPSPWAVFDAWGAGCGEIVPPLAPHLEQLLEPDSVRIPRSETERQSLAGETDILKAYDQLLQGKSSVHFGYPYNLMYDHAELYEFMKYSINNLGDPYVPSNYGVHSRQFECAVIDFFADLWKMEKDSYWGYVTTSGTEGNLHGILLARECHPDAVLYTSQETHYSVFKAARYYRMDCESIPTLPMGEIDYDLLGEAIDRNRDRDVIMNVNIGTTVKGAVDNLDRILETLQEKNIPRERFHIHCDGALFALMMPFVDHAPEITFQKPIDSIAVSGHKMLGCPMPCGITLSRKEHVKKVEQHIDYLNSVDTTIMGSRNGQAALYLWYSLRKKGVEGIKRDVV